MRSYLSLAWKELKVQRVTSVLILLAIILSTIATTVMGRSIGILQSMRIDQAASLNGDRYATFHQLTEEQQEVLHEDPRLKDVGSLMTVGITKLADSSLTLYLREYYGDALSAYPEVGRIKEGRLPERAGEIALSEETLRYLGWEGDLGDRITLPLSIARLQDDQPPYEYVRDFTLTGILEHFYLGYATGFVDGIVGEGTAKETLPEHYIRYSVDFKTATAKGFQQVVSGLADELNLPEAYIQYNWILLDALGIDYGEKESSDMDKGFPFMIAACVMVGVLILLAAGLVIYNILKVTVAKRIREYGTLRAIGGEAGQLYALVTVQLAILCGLGLPPGMLLGVLSAKGILMSAMGFLNPKLFMAGTEQELNRMIAQSGTGGMATLFLSALVTLLFAVAAAYPSARYASRISPTAAMSGQTVKIRRKYRKMRKTYHFEEFYARLNLKRNRGRTAITILSIVMSITVFVALQSFSRLLDTSRRVKEAHLGDYAVTNELAGMSPAAVEKLKACGMVSGLATSKLTVYEHDEEGGMPVTLDFQLQSWETFQIAAVNEERFADLAEGTELTPEDLEALRNGSACLAVNAIPFSYQGQEVERTALERGDVITVNGRRLRVAGIANRPITVNNGGYLNGLQIIAADAAYDALTGGDRYAEVYPTLDEEADPETFERWLAEWRRENGGTHWLSYRQMDAEFEESFEQINLLCWGLILFIGLIGILNIVNTVYTNIHTRVSEIGMQRAVGMSVGSLYKTFLWEGAYYGIIASLIGAVSGYVCTIFVEAADNGGLKLAAIPVRSILEASAVSVAACMIATAIPLRAIGRQSIVEAIEAME